MEFLTLAKDRYSCRMLDSRPVEQEKIDRIVEAALSAPTAVNKQPFRVFVLQSPEALAKAGEAFPFDFVRKAPVLFVIGAKPEEAWVRGFDGRCFADVDASIVATHVMLAIHDLGLGSTWIGNFDPAKMKAAFPEMEGLDLVALFPAAYPAQDAAPSPRHTVCRPAEELVSTL